MKILICCESSGTVREAFRAKGHDAWSCDLLPADDGSPYHLQGDCLKFLDEGWDLFGFHPPCTYLSVSGIHWNNRGRGWENTEKALEFVRAMMARTEPWYLENPVSIISSHIRKPDQIIQPYQFGHDASKKTCLWLNKLEPISGTKYVEPRYVCCGLPIDVEKMGMRGCPNCCGDKPAKPRWGNQTDSGQNKLAPSKDRWKERSKTYSGIALAMSQQWG